MIAFLVVLVVLTFFGVVACSMNGWLCYKYGNSRIFNSNAQDSEEEIRVRELNIQADGYERRKPNKCRSFIRRQWFYNTCSLIISIFYLVVSGFALFSLTGSKYGMEATKPLNMTQEFTL